MSSIDKDHYRDLKNNFIKETKRVLKENLTINLIKHKEYEVGLTKTYNNILDYVDPLYEKIDQAEVEYYRGELIYLRDKLLNVSVN